MGGNETALQKQWFAIEMPYNVNMTVHNPNQGAQTDVRIQWENILYILYFW